MRIARVGKRGCLHLNFGFMVHDTHGDLNETSRVAKLAAACLVVLFLYYETYRWVPWADGMGSLVSRSPTTSSIRT